MSSQSTPPQEDKPHAGLRALVFLALSLVAICVQFLLIFAGEDSGWWLTAAILWLPVSIFAIYGLRQSAIVAVTKGVLAVARVFRWK